MKTKFKLLSLSASLLLCGLGMSGNAQAEAYAVSTDNIKNGLLTFTGALNFGSPASLSSSAASLNGSGQSGSAAGPPAPDSPASNGTGAPPAFTRTNEMVFTTGAGNTYYSLFGPQKTVNYSGGDAKIVSEQTGPGTFVEARNIAGSNIGTTGFADADGRNSSSTLLSAPVSCSSASCTIDFSFLADPYIQVLLDAAAGPGSVARGVLAVNISLRQVGASVDFFSWAPNGVVGNGIVGGTEIFDDENLNLTVTQLTPGTTTFSGPYASDVFGKYEAFTNPFGPGNYVLSLSSIEKTDVKRTAVPEPEGLALVGLALAGLAITRRRKQV